MIQAMEPLKSVAQANFPYDFVDKRQERAKSSIDRDLGKLIIPLGKIQEGFYEFSPPITFGSELMF